MWFSDLLWLGVDPCGVVSACVKHDDGILGDFGDVLAGAGEVKPAGRLVIIPGEKLELISSFCLKLYSFRENSRNLGFFLLKLKSKFIVEKHEKIKKIQN